MANPIFKRRHVPAIANCRPFAFDILSRVGDKWTIVVIGQLATGRQRFSEVRRAIPGISQRMLTLTLKGLERDGLVRRTVYPDVPVRVEYELTERARTLIEPLGKIADWAETHQGEIEQSRRDFDAAD